MEFDSKPKVPRLLRAVAAVQGMQSIMADVNTIGGELADVVVVNAELATLITTAVSDGILDRGELRAILEEIESSNADVLAKIESIEKTLEDLKQLCSTTKEGNAKIEKIALNCFDLITNVNSVIWKLGLVVEKVDTALNPDEDLRRHAKDILKEMKDIGDLVVVVEKNVDEIVDMIRGEDNEGIPQRIEKESKDIKGNSKNDRKSKNKAKARRSTEYSKLHGKNVPSSIKDGENCWAKFKSSCSCV